MRRLLCSSFAHAALALVVLLLSTAAAASAQGKYNKVLAIGDTAPGWKGLPATNGKDHALADLSDIDVVVVCFTSNTCLYSIDYEERLIELHRKYAASGKVSLVAINSNAVPADDLDHMKQRAQEQQFPFAYVRDADQKVAKAWGAIYTPEFFVLNSERRIVYMGAMDDNTDPKKVAIRYVELAIDATLQGNPVQTTETAARGCTIRMPRRRKPEPDPISRDKPST